MGDARSFFVRLERQELGAMVPVIDSFNHRNGRWHNTVASWVLHDGYTVSAKRDIVAGEQLYISYHDVEFGAPRIFEQYGFVEQTPALWWLDADGMRYRFVIMDDEGNVEWRGEKQGRVDFEAFVVHARPMLSRLLEKIAFLAEDAGKTASAHRELAVAYMKAY